MVRRLQPKRRSNRVPAGSRGRGKVAAAPIDPFGVEIPSQSDEGEQSMEPKCGANGQEAPAPANAPAVPQTFLCSAEDAECPADQICAQDRAKFLRGKPKALTCVVCMKTYKELTRRWKREKKLKAWYQTMSKEKKVAWYRNHKAATLKMDKNGQKLIKLSKKRTRKFSQRCKALLHWQPWHIYKRNKKLDGVADEAEIRRRWKMDLMDPNVKKRKKNGRWLIAEDNGEMGEEEDETAMEAVVEDLVELDSKTDPKEQVDEFMQACEEQLSELKTEPPCFEDDAPEIADSHVEGAEEETRTIGLMGRDSLVESLQHNKEANEELQAIHLT